jgi:hypothetical protein
MKRSIITLFLLVSIILASHAQSEALLQQIEMDKKEAASNGYKILDMGGFKTSDDYYMQFDVHDFYSGTEYLLVFYIEGCSTCEPGMYFKTQSTGEVQEFFPKYKRASNALRAIYNFKQGSYVKGDLVIYSKTATKYYTYGMLFKR